MASYAILYKGQPIEWIEAKSPKAALTTARKRYSQPEHISVRENKVDGKEFK